MNRGWKYLLKNLGRGEGTPLKERKLGALSHEHLLICCLALCSLHINEGMYTIMHSYHFLDFFFNSLLELETIFGSYLVSLERSFEIQSDGEHKFRNSKICQIWMQQSR